MTSKLENGQQNDDDDGHDYLLSFTWLYGLVMALVDYLQWLHTK